MADVTYIKGYLKADVITDSEGDQAAAVADLTDDYATPDLDTEAELIVAINATNTAVNAIKDALVGAGIIAAS